MAVVEIVHWNPKRPAFEGRLGRLLPLRLRINNFGDLLGPLIARLLVDRAGLSFKKPIRSARVLCVGSILSLAKPGDIVWGVGINGKSLESEVSFEQMDFRSVRGPGTFAWATARGGNVPAVFGDPGLLVPYLFDLNQMRLKSQQTDYLVVPNLNDFNNYDRDDPHVLDPRSPLDKCVAAIASAGCVVGSSLHALVLADAMAIPNQRIISAKEPDFKYKDYYEGAGYEYRVPTRTVDDALKSVRLSSSSWKPQQIIEVFPFELWTRDVNAAVDRVLHSFSDNL